MPEIPFADGSAAAIAKGLYGMHLTAADYTALLGCATVSAAAAKLKGFRGYGDVVSGLDPMTVPRARLEQLLRGKIYRDIRHIRRYMEAAGNRFCDFFRMSFDVLQLTDAISALSGEEDYLIRLPDYFTGDSDLPLYELAEAKTEADIIAVSDGTPYADVTRRAIEAYGPQNDSQALYLTFASYETQRFGRLPHSRDAMRLYRRKTDLELLKLMYRVCSFDRALSAANDASVCDVLSLPASKAAAVLRAQDTAAFRQAMRGTEYRALAGAQDFYAAADELLYAFARDAIRYSRHADAVVLAYVYLSQIETQNIIHIIEGIRYHLPQSVIRPLLCGSGEAERR